MARKKAKRPTRRLPGITLVSSGGWKWRGVARKHGKQVRGPVRATQDEAYQDHVVLAGGGVVKREAQSKENATLAYALERVVLDARERGLSEHTIRGTYEDHSKFLLRELNPACPIAEYGVDDVQSLIRVCLNRGRKAVTIRRKDMTVLSRAYQLLGLFDPTREAIQRMKAALAGAQSVPEMPFFTAEEVRTIIDRIRHEDLVGVGGRKVTVPKRQMHADLLELVASTGIRAQELARLRVQDVSLDPLELNVRSKDKANPRVQAVAPNAKPALRRLVTIAYTDPEQYLMPGGMRWLNAFSKGWSKRLRIPGLHARALRHSYATIMLDAGVSLATVMELLGHRRVSTTARYIHAIDTRRAEAAEILGQQLSAPRPRISDPRTD